MNASTLNVLFIDDDEDDYLITKHLVSKFEYLKISLDWVNSYEAGQAALLENQHDACLLDYRLGPHDGVALVREALQHRCRIPIIMLTGQEDYDVDVEAMRAGAVDYMVKAHINGLLLERALRYAVERKRVETQLESSREQLRALVGRLTTVREEERKDIAWEVHDVLGQALTGLKMDIAWLDRRFIDSQIGPDSSLRQRLHAMSKSLDSTIQAVQQISTRLRPSILDDLGLEAAIEWEVQEFEKRTDIRCDYVSSIEDLEPSHEQSIAIFRILQEALTNIARHANATQVSVILEENNNQLRLEVQDNGRGITENEISSMRSLGIVEMQERALVVGGAVKITGIPGKGTTIWISLPLNFDPTAPEEH